MAAEQSLLDFVKRVNSELGVEVPASLRGLSETDAARLILDRVNNYFFQTHGEIGRTRVNDEEYQYFSEFHKYWERHHEELLGLSIDRDQVAAAARSLAAAVTRYSRQLLEVTQNTHGLSPKAIAQVRFLTANQDFRAPPGEAYKKYLESPEIYDPAGVAADPADFLKSLGATRLSQTDKRLDFAKNASTFLLSNGISAFEIASHFTNDAVEIRDGLVAVRNMGYGLKKANMFVRDMVELGVWPNLSNFDGIDVASDINTMKLALRTRILRPKTPLVSSFLDIFGYQYELVDRMSAKAWRHVWEAWRQIEPASAPRSPSQMDYLLYRIGREYCRPFVAEYQCPAGHIFRHFGGALRLCKECGKQMKKSSVRVVRWILPCQVSEDSLPHEGGKLLIDSDNLLHMFGGVCILESACEPKLKSFRPFDPPKSISIVGQTSWTKSYSQDELGGGGMMG